MAKLKPGDKAPSFTLLNQEGVQVALEQFRGQKVLLYFYPKADTPGCTIQSCSIRDALPDLGKAGLVPLGISPDAPEAQKRFDEKHSLRFCLLSDTLHNVAEAYGAWGEKTMYGKRFKGIIRSAFLIDETGTIESAWYKVKPEDTVPNALKRVG